MRPLIPYILELANYIDFQQVFPSIYPLFFAYQQARNSHLPCNQFHEGLLCNSEAIIELILYLISIFCPEISRSDQLCRALKTRQEEDRKRVEEYGYKPEQKRQFDLLYNQLDPTDVNKIIEYSKRYIILIILSLSLSSLTIIIIHYHHSPSRVDIRSNFIEYLQSLSKIQTTLSIFLFFFMLSNKRKRYASIAITWKSLAIIWIL